MSDTEAHASLAGIHIYPLKAARGIDLQSSLVERWGLAGDRRWLVVDKAGRFISQREEPAMARVTIGHADHALTVSAAGHPELSVPAPSGDDSCEMLDVTVSRSRVMAAGAGPAADRWFSEFLGRRVRLVYLDDPTRRPVNPAFSTAGDVVSFADGYPLLLTSMASLGALGEWLIEDGDQPVPMSRFRPSVVVAGSGPWAEDGWRRIRIGAVSFRVVKPCGRCVVTTIDQITGEIGKQPLSMLGRRRLIGTDLVFGQYMIPEAPGIISVGDPVQILEDTRLRRAAVTSAGVVAARSAGHPQLAWLRQRIAPAGDNVRECPPNCPRSASCSRQRCPASAARNGPDRSRWPAPCSRRWTPGSISPSRRGRERGSHWRTSFPRFATRWMATAPSSSPRPRLRCSGS